MKPVLFSQSERKFFNYTVLLAITIFFFIPFFIVQPVLAKEPYKIDIYTFKVGTSFYVTGIALAELLNKHSTWVKATAVETPGPTSNHKTMALKPELRKKVLWMSTPEVTFQMERKWPPFDKLTYTTSRFVAVQGFGFKGFVTLDPKTKMMSDLSGKRVSIMRKSAQGLNKVLGMLFEASGAKNVKSQHLGLRGGNSALKDGQVDAGLAVVNLKALPDKFAPIPSTAQLISTKDVHFINFSEKTFDNLRNMIGEGFLYQRTIVPPGTMSKLQTEPWTVMGLSQGFYADIEMPDDVVYEVCRIIYEYGHKFGEYSPSLSIMGKDTISRMDAREEGVHPGALAFFKEKGLKIKPLF